MSGRLLLCCGAAVFFLLPVKALEEPLVSGSLVQVTDEIYAEYHPRIDGDVVVFTALSDGSENIVFVDLESGERRQVTFGPDDQRLQDISGHRIVYSDHSGMDPDVFVYDMDLDATDLLVDEEGSRDGPAIHGDLVAYVNRSLEGDTSIGVADLSTGESFSITSGDWLERWPTVGPGVVAFERTVDGDSLVFLHDMDDGSERMLLEGASNQRRPHIDDDRVVFDAFVDGRTVRDLIVYEISTGALHHIEADGNQSYARIWGDWIAFDDDAVGISDIVLLHLPSGFSHRFTNPEDIDFLNDIQDGRVVFTSNSAGKFDIWMFEFEALLPENGEDDPPDYGDIPGLGEPLSYCDEDELSSLGDSLFETTMVRVAGEPEVESHHFSGSGPAVVVVKNDRCGAGWADLNGEPLFVPDDLDATLVCLWGLVELEDENTLDISVRAKPGCSVSVAFYPPPLDSAMLATSLENLTLSCETGSGAAWLALAMVLFGFAFGVRWPRLIPVRRSRDPRAGTSRRLR